MPRTTAAHRFRIAVERLDDAPSAPRACDRHVFEVGDHDDLLEIIARVRAGGAFTPEHACALALGVKLFSGVMLAHRDDPLFDAVQPAMRAFIGNLKSRVAAKERA